MVKKRNRSEPESADDTPDVAVKADNDSSVEDALSADEDAMVEDRAGDEPSVEDAADDAVDVDPVDALKAEADKNLEGWQRTLAEFQNYKRRVTREQQALRKRVSLDTLADLLPIIDDFERALANIPEDLQGNAWVDGVALIETKFHKLLDDYDVEILDPVGEEFDPNHHQAIGTVESDAYESGQVVETLQKGYLSDKTLLRPALVTVAS